MSTSVDGSKTNKAGTPPAVPPRVPPDERFWKRYSPHHEFPLSLSSSLFLHILGLGVLLFGGFLLIWAGFQDTPPPMDAIVIAGGGGNPEGVGNAPGDGAVPQGPEAVKDNPLPPEKPSQEVPEAKLTKPEAVPPQLADQLPSTDRLLALENSAVGKQLNEVGKKAMAALQDQIAGKGQGGPGKGGGKGKGEGTGEGDLSGPGKANISQRQKRQMRWVMIFDTKSGLDYLRQLQGLGAILAIPTPGGDYLVIRDLKQRPIQPKQEDLHDINRIYWIDDKPDSVESLSTALDIHPTPSHIVAFFPVELENELFDKEMKAARGTREDDIKETYFRVESRGRGRYEPVVQRVQRR